MNKDVVLFDLDGVIIDTELQYSLFWKEIGHKYLGLSDLDQQIKGLTLEVILGNYFKDAEVNRIVSDSIKRYEEQMKYSYIPGFDSFVEDLRKNNVRMGVVTSSNIVKMNNVYAQHPEFRSYFEFILTADDYDKSKPDPECFLKGMNLLGATVDNTFIFEDSLNGLKAAKNTGAITIGLTTTNSRESVKELCDYVINDFKGLEYSFLSDVRNEKNLGATSVNQMYRLLSQQKNRIK